MMEIIFACRSSYQILDFAPKCPKNCQKENRSLERRTGCRLKLFQDCHTDQKLIFGRWVIILVYFFLTKVTTNK